MLSKELQAILVHSANTVPYYTALFKKYNINPLGISEEKDLLKIPVLTKDTVQSSPDSFLSTDFLRYPKRSDLMLYSTSGSTGKCMHVQWSKLEYIRSMFPLWIIRKKIYGIDTNDKLLCFHTNIFSGNALINDEKKSFLGDGRILTLSNLYIDKNQLEFYYNEMIDFQPVWMSVQPSVAYLLADYIKRNNKQVPESLKYIELTGEYLFDNVLNKIQDIFNISIANMYGMVEFNGIAYQCKNGCMHVINSNALVEILNSDKKMVNKGEEGEIHVTSLTNTAMPLIRYETGDRGILYDGSSCSCGNAAPVLTIKAGRVSEFVDMQDNQKLTPHFFCYPVNVINDEMGNPIKQFQVIQNDIDDFLITFVLETSFKGWENSIEEYYIKLIESTCLKSARWNFVFKDSIYPDGKTGKYKFFINKTKNKESICV